MNKKQVDVQKDSWDKELFTVHTSTNGGQARTSVFTGSLGDCWKIASAFVAVGYEATSKD